MQLTADQELRRELLLFSLSKHSDLEAAIKIAAEMEQFVLRGSGADGCAGPRPAEVMVNAAQSGEGFLPDGPTVPRDLLYHKMNGLTAPPPDPHGSPPPPEQRPDSRHHPGVTPQRPCAHENAARSATHGE